MRQYPADVIRFLFIMYVKQTTRLMWNGVYSSMFRVLNGGKQGGVASPVMFCVYIDELLSGLRDSPLELHLTTSELWFGQEQEGILP